MGLQKEWTCHCNHRPSYLCDTSPIGSALYCSNDGQLLFRLYILHILCVCTQMDGKLEYVVEGTPASMFDCFKKVVH